MQSRRRLKRVFTLGCEFSRPDGTRTLARERTPVVVVVVVVGNDGTHSVGRTDARTRGWRVGVRIDARGVDLCVGDERAQSARGFD